MHLKHGRFYVPFTKVDKERRIVWGIAQTEDPDTQNDLVTFEASVEAFNKWAGNVREMHDEIAVGRAIEVIADPETRTIHVGTYISKGAEDTWQKILDGTLRGYSIGGRALEASKEFVKSLGRHVRKITKYVLDELSLVDTPANSLCVITAVQKRGSLLVATDVLGHAPTAQTAGDVLSLQNGVIMKTLKKRVKAQSLVKFAQGLDEKDGVIVARITDFSKDDKGNFILKSAAPIAQLSKGDLEQDGYTDPSDEVAPEVPVVDFGAHAENAALMHNDLCKMAGIEDPVAHYQETVEGDPDEGGGLDEGDQGGNGDPDFGKSRGTRRGARSRRRIGRSSGSDVGEIVKNAIGELAKSFDAKLDAMKAEGTIAPRKESLEGAPITKSAGESIGTESTPLDKINADLTAAYEKRNTLLNKRAGSITDEDRREGEALAKQISKLEVARDTIAAASARG